MSSSDEAILEIFRLGTPPWPTLDPFLFCVHHKDAYPAGTPDLAVASEALQGRRIGMDFSGKDGFSMYHGHTVPGFPQHPHRGFETVTLARHGNIDHADSLGAKARFGEGDVQWMTAGRGIVHAEMFPLLRADRPNPTELFQLWLNLPREDKMVEPYFTMLWSENLPLVESTDRNGHTTKITVIAGALQNHTPPKPPPNSWASRPEARVAIWLIRMPTGASWECPVAPAECHRVLYFFEGRTLDFNGHTVKQGRGIRVAPEKTMTIQNTGPAAELLLLQGKPIGEPVVQHGPFVMNEPHEIAQAIADHQRSGFGGWPWDRPDPTHGPETGRFAQHADGRLERPERLMH